MLRTTALMAASAATAAGIAGLGTRYAAAVTRAERSSDDPGHSSCLGSGSMLQVGLEGALPTAARLEGA